jgi:hypothetical protein
MLSLIEAQTEALMVANIAKSTARLTPWSGESDFCPLQGWDDLSWVITTADYQQASDFLDNLNALTDST